MGIVYLQARRHFKSGAEGAQPGNEKEKLAHAHCTTRSRRVSTYICVRSEMSSSALSVLGDQDYIQAWELHMCTVHCRSYGWYAL